VSSAAYIRVGYACVRENDVDLGSPDRVTVHNGEWALCVVPPDIQHEHRWVRTGGVTYVQLITRLARSPAFRRKLERGQA